MNEKAYKRQNATIIAIIAVTLVLIIATVVVIIIAANNTKSLTPGNEMVTVGNYVGQKYDEVNAEGLKFEKVEVFSAEPEGTVVQQNYPEGAEVKKNSVVTLNVSKGAGAVEVPYVVGKSEDEAIKILRDNGFEVSVHYAVNVESEPEGTVKACSPSSGDKVAYGSKVIITVWGDSDVATTTVNRPTTTKTQTPIVRPSTSSTTSPSTDPNTDVTTDPNVTTDPTQSGTNPTQPTTEPSSATQTTTNWQGAVSSLIGGVVSDVIGDLLS